MARGRRIGAGDRRVRGVRVLSGGGIPYGRQRIDPGDVEAVDGVLASEYLTTGPAVDAFESALAEYCGAEHAVAVSSGTAALYGACFALGLAAGTEGIVPALTFAATGTCLLHAGARPVFVDVLAATGNVDPAAAESAITPLSRVIMPVHFAGLPADMAAVADIASRRSLAVIEDASHALGASIDGVKIGACDRSDMAIFSFHPIKAITTGEGGAVLTNDANLAERVRLWRNHGMQKYPAQGGWYYEIESLGENARITDLQCALGLSQLSSLDTRIAERNAIAAAYDRLLEPLSEVVLLPPRAPEGVRHAYHLYPIRFVEKGARRRVYDELHAAGIRAQVHYVPAHWHPVFKPTGVPERDALPNAEAWYESELSLPIYPGLEYDDQVRVISVLTRTLRT